MSIKHYWDGTNLITNQDVTKVSDIASNTFTSNGVGRTNGLNSSWYPSVGNKYMTGYIWEGRDKATNTVTSSVAGLTVDSTWSNEGGVKIEFDVSEYTTSNLKLKFLDVFGDFNQSHERLSLYVNGVSKATIGDGGGGISSDIKFSGRIDSTAVVDNVTPDADNKIKVLLKPTDGSSTKMDDFISDVSNETFGNDGVANVSDASGVDNKVGDYDIKFTWGMQVVLYGTFTTKAQLVYDDPSPIYAKDVEITPLNATLSGSTAESWSVTSLPDGLSFNATTGEISGTPTTTGTFTPVFTATYNSTPFESNSNLTIEVRDPPDITYPLPNTTYTYNVAIDPNVPNVTLNGFTIATWQASVPASLEFNEGTISGIPNQVGTFTVSPTATLTNGQIVDIGTVQFTVLPQLVYDDPSPIYAKDVMITPLNATLSGSTAESWSVTSLPDGLSFNATTGQISGTPTTTGTFTPVFTATYNSTPYPFNSILTITVRNPPDITYPLPNPTYTYNVAIDPNVPNVTLNGFTIATWQASVPAGLEFNEGTISGTPNQVGTFTVSPTATLTNGQIVDIGTVQFSVPNPDDAHPVVDNLQVEVATDSVSKLPTGETFSFTVDEPCTLWYIVRLQSEAAPEVVAGSGTSVILTSAMTHTVELTDLNMTTDYAVYLVAEDNASAVDGVEENNSSPITVIQFTSGTPSLPALNMTETATTMTSTQIQTDITFPYDDVDVTLYYHHRKATELVGTAATIKGGVEPITGRKEDIINIDLTGLEEDTEYAVDALVEYTYTNGSVETDVQTHIVKTNAHEDVAAMRTSWTALFQWENSAQITKLKTSSRKARRASLETTSTTRSTLLHEALSETKDDLVAYRTFGNSNKSLAERTKEVRGALRTVMKMGLDSLGARNADKTVTTNRRKIKFSGSRALMMEYKPALAAVQKHLRDDFTVGEATSVIRESLIDTSYYAVLDNDEDWVVIEDTGASDSSGTHPAFLITKHTNGDDVDEYTLVYGSVSAEGESVTFTHGSTTSTWDGTSGTWTPSIDTSQHIPNADGHAKHSMGTSYTYEVDLRGTADYTFAVAFGDTGGGQQCSPGC